MKRQLRAGLGVMVGVGLLGPSSITPQHPLGREVRIEGDASCRHDTQAALDTLKERDISDYRLVLGNIGVIQCVSKGSSMEAYADPPRFLLGDKTRHASLTWLASAIVHDSVHSELYRSGEEWQGQAAEAKCIEVQKNALVHLGAPQTEIAYLESTLSTEYWKLPEDKNNW